MGEAHSVWRGLTRRGAEWQVGPMHLPFPLPGIGRRKMRERPAHGTRLADGSRVFYIHAGDDVLLAGRVFGERHATERLGVVCLPGLSRNSADFSAIANHLAYGMPNLRHRRYRLAKPVCEGVQNTSGRPIQPGAAKSTRRQSRMR